MKANQPRQPTLGGERLGFKRTSLARRGCALWLGCVRYHNVYEKNTSNRSNDRCVFASPYWLRMHSRPFDSLGVQNTGLEEWHERS
jgi:hypothetical protein